MSADRTPTVEEALKVGISALHESLCGSPPSCGSVPHEPCRESHIRPRQVRAVVNAVLALAREGAEAREREPDGWADDVVVRSFRRGPDRSIVTHVKVFRNRGLLGPEAVSVFFGAAPEPREREATELEVYRRAMTRDASTNDREAWNTLMTVVLRNWSEADMVEARNFLARRTPTEREVVPPCRECGEVNWVAARGGSPACASCGRTAHMGAPEPVERAEIDTGQEDRRTKHDGTQDAAGRTQDPDDPNDPYLSGLPISMNRQLAEPVEQERPEIVTLALCEQSGVIMRPDLLYRFQPHDGCARCKDWLRAGRVEATAEATMEAAAHQWRRMKGTDVPAPDTPEEPDA